MGASSFLMKAQGLLVSVRKLELADIFLQVVIGFPQDPSILECSWMELSENKRTVTAEELAVEPLEIYCSLLLLSRDDIYFNVVDGEGYCSLYEPRPSIKGQYEDSFGKILLVNFHGVPSAYSMVGFFGKDSYGLFHDRPFLDSAENLAVDTIISLASLVEAKNEGGDQQGGFSIVASMLSECGKFFMASQGGHRPQPVNECDIYSGSNDKDELWYLLASMSSWKEAPNGANVPKHSRRQALT
ncbi:hypothetical protein C4D60_Mb07t28580 [Musa balbisiana]|uniref:Ribonuclease II winged helix domain-containing protein n=1 Tax=Musa balbisiana TaxID=52838 RepID=A0A4S8JKP1_MUSBA|nr:hypothetical protein C4D60_Mb07t28580 [Musa balbisiana]